MTITLPGNKPTSPTVLNILKSPTAIQRSVLTPNVQFLSEYMFGGNFDTPSGVAEYYVESMDNLYAAHGDAEIIEPMAEYPLLDIDHEQKRLVSTDKFGTGFKVSYEAVRRNNYNPITKGRLHIRNHVVRLDAARSLAAVDAAVAEYSQSSPATATWGTTGAARHDVGAAQAAAPTGYDPDAMLISKQDAFLLTQAEDIRTALQYTATRENAPIYNSVFSPIGGLFGLEVLINDFVPQGKVYLVKRGRIGGVALEQPLLVRQIDKPESDHWRVQGSMLSAPFVDAPGAVQVITGVS